MRRIKRDVNERGRSMDSVMAQYQKQMRPMFLQVHSGLLNLRGHYHCRAAEKPHRDRYIESEVSSLNKLDKLCAVQ